MPVAPAWQPIVVDGAALTWLPIIELSTGIAVGISSAATWLVGDARRCITTSSEPAVVRLLVLLEMSPLAVRTQLDDGLLRAGLSDRTSARGVMLDAVRAGLSSGMDYWAGLATGWLAAMEPATELIDLLDAFTRSSWASQPVRHAALRALRRARPLR